ncbi:DUF4427 domain-containing protein [Salinarimonas rosea]|uniref:DUF4427 domain-containing protein n=1 Tax=Salinarimonas rosea TaxID=552063 RepID=UPI000404A980|nr:DUF4427 domain-containing protein [Salinarimonas rosea]
MARNDERYDLSDRLIHFFRAVRPYEPDTPPLPEVWSGGHLCEGMDDPISPFFLIRNAVRQGRIWATWSVRGGRRTVYGPDPAVCFTEMPIAAFIEAGVARSAMGQAMSAYGLVLPKAAAFGLGARPVIYALDEPARVTDRADGPRLIDPTQMPEREQYRYVTYDPTGGRPIDWTHEREWRWPLRGAPAIDLDDPPAESDDYPGFDLDRPELTGIGVVVRTSRQAEHLVADILAKVDRGDVPRDHYEFVIALDAVPRVSDLRDRAALMAAIDAARIDLSSFFAMTEEQAAPIGDAFSALVSEVENASAPSEAGEFGGCWLWILDARAELTRALLLDGRAFVSRKGKYLVRLYGFRDDRSLRQRQEMTERLAALAKERFGVTATYFSVLGSDDPDGLPFYNGDMLDERSFYNHARDADDY